MPDLMAEVQAPMLRRFHAYWLERRRPGRLPARSDIDPLDLKFALGNIVLMDVLYDPLRFYYRLIGSNLTNRVGFDLTGKFAHEYPNPEYREIILSTYPVVVERRMAVLNKEQRIVDGRVLHFEALSLPLAADGVTVDMIIKCQMYFTDDAPVFGAPNVPATEPVLALLHPGKPA